MIIAEIKDYVKAGNPEVIRRGSLHFLPKTPVLVTFIFDELTPRLEVRGIHKSGIYVTIPVHLKYFQNIREEEIAHPDPEWLRYMIENGPIPKNLNRYLDGYADLLNQEPVRAQPISDTLFLKAQDFVRELKRLAELGDLEAICKNHMRYPIEIQWRKESKFQSEFLTEIEFITLRQWQIVYELKESILRTECETIFPLNGQLILGFLVVHISKDYTFKIVKIHTERKRLSV